MGAHRITWNLDRGITGLHKGVTVIHSSAARWRWRRIWNPVHAALIKGVGHSVYTVNIYIYIYIQNIYIYIYIYIYIFC